MTVIQVLDACMIATLAYIKAWPSLFSPQKSYIILLKRSYAFVAAAVIKVPLRFLPRISVNHDTRLHM
jgi:hypothetical protein